MRRFNCWLLIALVAVGGSVAAPLLAAGLDKDKVWTELLKRFDENSSEKLESLEAKLARTRLRNLLEDKSDREINIHTWREDVKPLLFALDPDEDRRLTSKERDAAVALLERLIPKVESDESRDKDKSSLGSGGSDRKRESSGRRSKSGYRGSGGWNQGGGSVGPWTMGGGGWGMNFGRGGSFGGGGSFSGGNSSIGTANAGSGFFSGSGLDNANPAKGDLGRTQTSNSKSAGNDQAQRGDRSSSPPVGSSGAEPLADSSGPDGSSPGPSSSGPSGTKPADKPGSPNKPASPDRLGGSSDTGGSDDSPKPSAPTGPKLIPPVPKPGF